MGFGYSKNLITKFFFFENQGILGWSIMLITDWLIWQFLPKNELGEF